MKHRLAAGEHVLPASLVERLGSAERFRELLRRINHPEGDTDGE